MGKWNVVPRQRARSAERAAEVVVTGMGMTTPLGGDVASTWQALLRAESGTSVIEDAWASILPIKLAARLRREPAETLDRVQLRRMDRSQQAAIVAAREAWADAGELDVAPERFAVVMGTGVGGALSMLKQSEVIRTRGAKSVSPFTIPMLMPNGAAAVVSLDLAARGGAHAPISACASGAEAIAAALWMLRADRADVVLAGGTDACVGKLALAGFARMGALSKREHDPDTASRPFHADRDGFVLGEGAGAVVLERADRARARGARVYGRLAGAGVTSDAMDMTTPDHEGQVRALTIAMANAQLSPSDITYINAHATGTPTGDLAEADAVIDAVGNHPLLSATKASTGHLIGGAGAVEAIFTILALREGVIPPTRNLTEQDPRIKLEVVVDTPYRTRLDAALSNSFGFGGHNVVLAFTRP
jgi:3-oxoacyl-[acyl-carrier-protein] synthase II